MVRFIDSGGESDTGTDDGLAPVIPLFGGRSGEDYPKTAAETQRVLEERLASRRVPALLPQTPGRDAAWRTEWDDEPTPGEPASADRPSDRTVVDTSRGRSRAPGATGATPDSRGQSRAGASPAEAGEQGLLKKLRSRQLSVSEARSFLSRLDVDAAAAETIIDAFLGRGYLDDARLAEQIVHAGVDRKGQGRQVIAQSLAKRGVPRDVADVALGELADDDVERALEFARSKADSLRGLERDVALRRLAGQLARRGYGGSVALTAARTALDEPARPSAHVRFEVR